MSKKFSGWPQPNEVLAELDAKDTHMRHLSALSNMKGQTNHAAPPRYKHMEVNLKKFQLEKERATQIQQNNQILLCKMLSIDSGFGEHGSRASQKNKPMKPSSLNSVKRQSDQRHINVQNQRLLGKIVNARSQLPTAVSINSQEKQRRQLLARMAKPKKLIALPKPPRTDLKYNMTVVTDVEKTLDRMERQLDRFSKQKKLQAIKDAKRVAKHKAKQDALTEDVAAQKANLPVVAEEATA